MGEIDRLIQDLLNTPEAVRRCIEVAGRTTVSTATSLSRSIKLGSRRILDASATRVRQQSSSQYSINPDVSGDGNSSGDLLPPLPLIRDEALERATFRHQGLQHEYVEVNKDTGIKEMSYDRLEVLGDAYIEIAATRLIWDTFPTLPAGRISQIRETLVKNETLAEFSSKYGFDMRVAIPIEISRASETKKWTKVKGDIFEAYVAAVVLSNPSDGYEQVENWLTHLWMPKIRSHAPSAPAPLLRAKQELAKKVLGKGVKLAYIDERPPAKLEGGMVTWYIGVYLTGWGWVDQHLGSGKGLSKVNAGNEAAMEALGNELLDEITTRKRASLNISA